MPTTSTILGRMKLDHPDLGHDGGATLETKIKTLYTRLGDSMASRLFTAESVANGASVDFDHNFQAAFDEMGFRLYTWDSGTGELTRVNPLTGWTIAATVGFLTKKVTVTNNTGSAKTFALWLFQWPLIEKLDDLSDVDLVSAAPEDGQAMVYNAALAKWVPGASGDSSFKLQGVTDPNATLKGGYLQLPDGRELATYDGAGSASADFGKDLVIDLDAILGASPANASTYYLYLDLATLGAAVTCTDTGRQLYAVQQANFILSLTAPEAMNRSRYVARGFIRSATTGTVWSGSGAGFGTLAFLQGQLPAVSVCPLVYSQTLVTVGNVGDTAQVRQGHTLAANSFPAAAQDTAKLSIYSLANVFTDSYGGRTLTAVNSPAGAVGIFNAANEAIALVSASSQYLSSTAAFFDPGNVNFAFGGWFYNADWVPSANQTLFGQGDASSDRGVVLILATDGTIIAYLPTSATTWVAITFSHGIPDATAGWHHWVVRYEVAGNLFTLFMDGKAVAQQTIGTAMRSITTDKFQIGALNGASFWNGKVDEFFAVVGVALTDADIAKLAATRFTHSKKMAASRQGWKVLHYAAGVAPATPWENAVLDQSDTDAVFVDLSGADPTDKVDVQLFDTGAAGAVSVPVQSPEFYLTANIPGAGVDTGLVEVPRSMFGFQLDNDGHWQPLDLVGLVYVDENDARKLKGDISSLAPSATNPVRIVVSSTASAQAVGKQTADNLVGMIDGSRNGGGIYLKRPDGTVRELALDDSDNIVVLSI